MPALRHRSRYRAAAWGGSWPASPRRGRWPTPNGTCIRRGAALTPRTIRTRTHKCTFELDSGAGELYDLVTDPQELVNRFDDPAYTKVRGALDELLRLRPGAIREPLAEPVGMACLAAPRRRHVSSRIPLLKADR